MLERIVEIGATPLWAELARWRLPALAVITAPEHWAIHGTTRMGKALTDVDRVPAGEIDAAAIAAGQQAAQRVMGLLERCDGTPVRWVETAGTDAAAAMQRAGETDLDAIEAVAAIAHALQAGAAVAPDAGDAELAALASSTPRAAIRASGPYASLLALSTESTWLPVALRSVWDGPAGVVGSAPSLREDLARLPARLRRPHPGESSRIAGARALVEALGRALELAGSAACVRIAS